MRSWSLCGNSLHEVPIPPNTLGVKSHGVKNPADDVIIGFYSYFFYPYSISTKENEIFFAAPIWAWFMLWCSIISWKSGGFCGMISYPCKSVLNLYAFPYAYAVSEKLILFYYIYLLMF